MNKSPPNIIVDDIEPDIGPQSIDRASRNSSLSRVDELLEEVDHDVVVLPLVVVGSSSVLCRKLRTLPIIGPRIGGFG